MGRAKRERATAPTFEYQTFEHFEDAFGRLVNYRHVNESPFPNRATRRKAGIRLPLNVVVDYGRLLVEAEELRNQAEVGAE
jgi:hypothetical protein